jgi:hypothetical protein
VVPPDEFLTTELWGVGSTAPLDTAPAPSARRSCCGKRRRPGGDPARQEARDAFAKLASDEQATVVSFLKSLVNFSPDR